MAKGAEKVNLFFDIVGQFLQIFVNMIPRFATRAPETDWMLVDSFLIGPHLAGSRPVAYMPIFDSVEYWPKTEENINTETQSLTTADGATVTIDTGFAYIIDDPLLLRSTLSDGYPTRAAMIVRGRVRELVCSHNFVQLNESHVQGKLLNSLEDDCQAMLEKYGLSLTYFCIEDFCPTRNIRHFGVTLSNTNIGGME